MLYNKYLKMHAKTAMQFKLNSFILLLTTTTAAIAQLLAIGILFSRFNHVGNWGFYESALMYGVIVTSFGATECFARGFDEFSNLIKHGDLDRLLVRPRNLIFQIFASKVLFIKMGRVSLGLIISIIAIANLNIAWTVSKVFVLIGMYFAGIFVFFGLMLISASVVIFTVEHPEFLNIITDGSKEIGYYPIDIYAKGFRVVFTYIIPVACFNYLPMSYILGIGNLPPIIYALSPLFGSLFVIPCLIIFNVCLKKYQSTGT